LSPAEVGLNGQAIQVKLHIWDTGGSEKFRSMIKLYYKDAAAAIFTGGVHSGINFSYNTATDIITATVDLSNYTGTINASAFKGTLVADDSTLLVDAVDGKINLDGTKFYENRTEIVKHFKNWVKSQKLQNGTTKNNYASGNGTAKKGTSDARIERAKTW
jgi:GTPase SAR1 family protein